MVRPAMRVVDLDRDMSDVIPTGSSLDSEFLYQRMTDATLELALRASSRAGQRVLDVASGVGQDSFALAERGARVVGAEPSQRMIGMAELVAARRERPLPTEAVPRWIRAWSDTLPFATGSFDACLCKGAIDHFDRPVDAIAEMARVTRIGGRVVLAIANFESLGLRVLRASDTWRERGGRRAERGRRLYDVPSDHFTRYELSLMREQASQHLTLEVVTGVSLGWGVPGWSQRLAGAPDWAAAGALQALDWIARRAPGWSDVVVLAGRPRPELRAERSASTSA